MKSGLFQDLILLLKNVKTEKDFSPELVDELLNAGIAGTVYLSKEEENLLNIEALEVARMTVLKHFDEILLDMHQNEDDYDELN
ncbi:MAG: hypothetical protein M3R27_08360 [Bacteroidota bacterium]|nr:hypothetical protein [Bacteroidota bacterium]